MFRSPVGHGAGGSPCGLQADNPVTSVSSFGRRPLIQALQRESAYEQGVNEALPAGQGARAVEQTHGTPMNVETQGGQFDVTPPSFHSEGGGCCNIREKAAMQAQVRLLNYSPP